jgi:hypothetical protein
MFYSTLEHGIFSDFQFKNIFLQSAGYEIKGIFINQYGRFRSIINGLYPSASTVYPSASTVVVPNFELYMEIPDLGVYLNRLGAKEAFNNTRSVLEKLIYGNPTQDKFDVIHKTFIKIGDKNVNFEDQTGVASSRTDFKLNYPFQFFIMENKSDVILFMGRIMGDVFKK